MKRFRQHITEVSTETAPLNTTLFSNATPRELVNLSWKYVGDIEASIRGLAVDQDATIYWWDATNLIHADIVDYLRLSERDFMQEDGIYRLWLTNIEAQREVYPFEDEEGIKLQFDNVEVIKSFPSFFAEAKKVFDKVERR